MEDNVLWLICERNGLRLCFYLLAPYLHEDETNFYAKLIYSTHKCFEDGNIPKVRFDKEKWYKTIHYMENDKRRTVDDFKVQELAIGFGFDRGHGIWSNINAVPKKSNVEIVYPPKVLDVYGKSNVTELLQEIADFYCLTTKDLNLSGSGGFFNSPISELSDLDIIIPINSVEQLSKINNQKIPLSAKRVRHKEKYWPLRWINNFDLIVCPFFVYGNIEKPVVKVKETNKRIKGNVRITNTNYGIFNVPLYECNGAIERLMVKTSFMRGKIENDSEFNIDCPVYEVTDGLWAGKDIAVITTYQAAMELLNQG